MPDPAFDTYTIKVWEGTPGEPATVDAWVIDVSYDAAREIVGTLGAFSNRVEATQCGSFGRDGARYRRQLSYVPSDVPPYREHDIKCPVEVAAYTRQNPGRLEQPANS